ncbi:MAG: hypothetical protein WBN81_18105 [Gammaproteobacteria bacterium]
MKLRTSLSIPILMLGAVLVTGCASSSPPLNFGDGSIGNLWYWVEDRKRAGDLDQTLIYMDKLIELHSAEAREMQASLSDYPPMKDIYNYGALNGVGMALVGKGEILMEKGDVAGSREAFNTIIRDFSYAQYQDDTLIPDYSYAQYQDDSTQEWLKAAEVAELKLLELQADSN